MSNDRFDLIMGLLKVLGLIAGAVISIAKYFKYLETKATERSVGATKIKELERADKEVQNDIEKLKDVDHIQAKEIENLNHDYTKLIDKVWDFLSKK